MKKRIANEISNKTEYTKTLALARCEFQAHANQHIVTEQKPNEGEPRLEGTVSE